MTSAPSHQQTIETWQFLARGHCRPCQGWALVAAKYAKIPDLYCCWLKGHWHIRLACSWSHSAQANLRKKTNLYWNHTCTCNALACAAKNQQIKSTWECNVICQVHLDMYNWKLGNQGQTISSRQQTHPCMVWNRKFGPHCHVYMLMPARMSEIRSLCMISLHNQLTAQQNEAGIIFWNELWKSECYGKNWFFSISIDNCHWGRPLRDRDHTCVYWSKRPPN